MKHRAIFIVAIVVMLLSIWPASVGASGSQTWYFSKDNYSGNPAVDGTIHALNKIMYKTAPSGPQQLTVIGEINSTNLTAWWYADQASQTDVDFQNGEWTVNLWYFNWFLTGTLYADVFSVKPSGAIDKLLATGSVPIGPSSNVKSLTITCDDNPASEQTVLETDRLAVRLRFEHNCVFTGMLVFYNSTCTPSSLTSPPADPGYPAPELSSILLFTGGLAGLVVYLKLQRRKEPSISS